MKNHSTSPVPTQHHKRKDFYIVPFEADGLGQLEHRLYCHYRRRAVESHGKPTVESMQDISIATGMGVSTISRARKVLALAGWITVTPGRPDKVTVYETPHNVPVVPIVVPVATTNVPVGNVVDTENNTNVPVVPVSLSVGNDSTFLGNKLRDARVENIEIEKELYGATLPHAVKNESQSTPSESPAKPPRKRDKSVKSDKPAPTPRPPDVLFDAIALGSFGIRDSAKVNGNGGRIGKVEAWVKANYPGATEKTLTAFYAWYAVKYPDTSAPRDPEKFAEHFVAFHDEVTTKRQQQQQSDAKYAELSALYEYQQEMAAKARAASAAAGKS